MCKQLEKKEKKLRLILFFEITLDPVLILLYNFHELYCLMYCIFNSDRELLYDSQRTASPHCEILHPGEL